VELARGDDVLRARAVSLRACLQDDGDVREQAVGEKHAEPLAHEAVRHGVVAVPVRPQRRLRVVHVQAAQAVEADEPVDVCQEGVEHVGIRHVVARGVQVAGVEAQP
jgi:hypothetical protein